MARNGTSGRVSMLSECGMGCTWLEYLSSEMFLTDLFEDLDIFDGFYDQSTA